MAAVESAEQLLQELVQRFNGRQTPAAVEPACLQIRVLGERGGSWVVQLGQDGRASLATGEAERPDVTVEVSAEDLQALASGRLSAGAAFLSGRLRVAGNLGLLLRLRPLLG